MPKLPSCACATSPMTQVFAFTIKDIVSPELSSDSECDRSIGIPGQSCLTLKRIQTRAGLRGEHTGIEDSLLFDRKSPFVEASRVGKHDRSLWPDSGYPLAFWHHFIHLSIVASVYIASTLLEDFGSWCSLHHSQRVGSRCVTQRTCSLINVG